MFSFSLCNLNSINLYVHLSRLINCISDTVIINICAEMKPKFNSHPSIQSPENKSVSGKNSPEDQSQREKTKYLQFQMPQKRPEVLIHLTATRRHKAWSRKAIKKNNNTWTQSLRVLGETSRETTRLFNAAFKAQLEVRNSQPSYVNFNSVLWRWKMHATVSITAHMVSVSAAAAKCLLYIEGHAILKAEI